MDVHSILDDVKAAMGPDRVFGEPIEQDGVIVVPAAKVAGGGGGGVDSDGEEGDEGGGVGFGMMARPAGALQIGRDGNVKWKIPFDVNRLVLGGQAVGIAFFFFRWLTERSKARAAARASIAVAALHARAAGGGS